MSIRNALSKFKLFKKKEPSNDEFVKELIRVQKETFVPSNEIEAKLRDSPEVDRFLTELFNVEYYDIVDDYGMEQAWYAECIRAIPTGQMYNKLKACCEDEKVSKWGYDYSHLMVEFYFLCKGLKIKCPALRR